MNRKIEQSIQFILVALIILVVFRLTLHYMGIALIEYIFFDFVPKWILLVLPFTFLYLRYKKKLPLYKSIFDFALTLLGIWILNYFITYSSLQKIDWRVNYTKRNKIVELAKQNRLLKLSESIYGYPGNLRLFPYLRPNQVMLTKTTDTTLSVYFTIDGSISDQYANIVYSNAVEELNKLDSLVITGKDNIKLETNWYLIH